jgi:uncharacterized protein (TIGR02231 family)
MLPTPNRLSLRVIAPALLLCLAPLPAFADAITATSRIDAVTVYRSGALVTRQLSQAVPAGTHALVFTDLPAEAVASSIRVDGSADGGLRIGAVDTRRVSVLSGDAAAQDAERQGLEDELQRLDDAMDALRAELETKETQKKLIANLTGLPQQPPPAAGSAAPGQNWSELLELIGSGMASLQADLLKTHIAMRELGREIEDTKKKIAELAPKQETRTEVRIALEADADLTADLTVSYQVQGASWAPLYEARLQSGTADEAAKLTLTRRASIRQHTGESWRDVAVKLSTSRPTARPHAPNLDPLMVDFYVPPQPAPAGGVSSLRSARPMAEEADVARKRVAPASRGAVAAAPARQIQAVLEQSAFEATYTVPGRTTIENAGEMKRVTLTAETIEPKLTVRTVPRRETNAYLYAGLTMPKDAPYLAGAVSLFRDNTYVGMGKLPDLAPGAKHEMGFGRDAAVTVKYDVIGEKRGESGIISSSTTDDRNYRVTVTNQHPRAIDVLVIDQMPVSLNEDITVDLKGPNAPDERNFEAKRGLLAWRFSLKPEAERKLAYGFHVAWPADKKVIYSHRR